MTLIAMLGALQPPLKRKGRFWSSSQINNWRTVNIHHYITLFDTPEKRGVLDGSCVPMNVDAATLAELSQINVEVNLRALRRRRKQVDTLYAALNAVSSGTFSTQVTYLSVGAALGSTRTTFHLVNASAHADFSKVLYRRFGC